MKQVGVKLLLATLLVGMVATNCGLNNTQRSATEKQVVETTQDGIILTLSTDKQVYQPGEIIAVEARVENASSIPFSYTMWSIGDPAIYVAVTETPYSGGVELYEKGHEIANVLPEVTADTLAPGQSITRKVIWDQLLPTYPQSIQAPSGKYNIRAVFHIGAYSSNNKPFPLTANVEIEITGTAKIITPEDALCLALELPEVKQWYDEHSGPNLVRVENGEYYVWFEIGWQKVDPLFTYNGLDIDQLQKYTPESNVLVTGEKWQVLLFTKLGPSPNEIRVEVDPIAGTAKMEDDGAYQK